MSESPSLYTRLGGYDAIVAVTENLLPRVVSESQLGRFGKHRKKKRGMNISFIKSLIMCETERGY